MQTIFSVSCSAEASDLYMRQHAARQMCTRISHVQVAMLHIDSHGDTPRSSCHAAKSTSTVIRHVQVAMLQVYIHGDTPRSSCHAAKSTSTVIRHVQVSLLQVYVHGDMPRSSSVSSTRLPSHDTLRYLV